VIEDSGWTRTYGVDMFGHVRDASTPYAGPHEYDSSTNADDPPLGGALIGALHRIDHGVVTQTAAGLGGVLQE
jgi:hypothetical protein